MRNHVLGGRGLVKFCDENPGKTINWIGVNLGPGGCLDHLSTFNGADGWSDGWKSWLLRYADPEYRRHEPFPEGPVFVRVHGGGEETVRMLEAITL